MKLRLGKRITELGLTLITSTHFSRLYFISSFDIGSITGSISANIHRRILVNGSKETWKSQLSQKKIVSVNFCFIVKFKADENSRTFLNGKSCVKKSCLHFTGGIDYIDIEPMSDVVALTSR